MGVIRPLGLMDDVAGKIHRFDKSIDVNGHIAEARLRALAFGPATEILAWRNNGIAWCGAILPEFQVALLYTAACLTDCENRRAAQTLLRFLKTPQSRAVFNSTGVEL